MKMPWPQFERRMREHAYDTLDRDPQILLEADAPYAGQRADLYFARMIGFDGQIIRDAVRLSRPEPYLLEPIPVPLRVRWSADDGIDSMLHMATARYVLQSGSAVLTVSAELTDPPVDLRPDQTVKVAYLRYLRRA